MGTLKGNHFNCKKLRHLIFRKTMENNSLLFEHNWLDQKSDFLFAGLYFTT